MADRPPRVYLTGALAIVDDDALLTGPDLPGAQGQVVVAVLALRRLRPVSVAELADALWSGTPPASWRSALKSVVSRSRSALRALDRVDIASGAGWYQLIAPADAIVDVTFAESSVHEAEVALGAGELEAAAPHAAVAAMISGRPALADVDHPFAAEVGAELLRVRVRALQVLVELWRHKLDLPLLLGDGSRLVSIDPLNEIGHAAVIEAHYRSGRTAQALRAYEACRRTLAAELGAAPNPRIQALYQHILQVT